MKQGLFFFPVLVFLIASPAMAQFASPTNSNEPACGNQRDYKPDFLDAFDFREAYRVTLIQRMYTSQALTTVVESGNCSCETRFPPWDAAVEYYQEHYAIIEDRFEIDARTTYYEGVTNTVRTEARRICKSQGNW